MEVASRGVAGIGAVRSGKLCMFWDAAYCEARTSRKCLSRAWMYLAKVVTPLSTVPEQGNSDERDAAYWRAATHLKRLDYFVGHRMVGNDERTRSRAILLSLGKIR